MKITLVQSEIEQAIQEYLARQMTVAEGNSMKIEIRATRVDNKGFTAYIDIYRTEDGPGSEQEHGTKPHIEAPAPAPQPRLRAASMPARQEESTSEEAAPEPEAAPETGQAEDPPFDPAPQQQEQAPLAAMEEAPKTEQIPTRSSPGKGGGRSLFGGLKKPVNA